VGFISIQHIAIVVRWRPWLQQQLPFKRNRCNLFICCSSWSCYCYNLCNGDTNL